jgi:hypothetical protein
VVADTRMKGKTKTRKKKKKGKMKNEKEKKKEAAALGGWELVGGRGAPQASRDLSWQLMG